LIADKLGRIRFMQLAAIVVTIGAILQTASVNIGMFLAGRVISGAAVGYALKPFHFLRGGTTDFYAAHDSEH
jgi:MFS family permease